MIGEGQYDPLEKTASSYSVMHSFEGSSTVYQWLLDQEEFSIDFEEPAMGVENIARALFLSQDSNASKNLEAVLTRMNNLKIPPGLLAHHAAASFRFLAAYVDFPNRIRSIWDAGADFHARYNVFRTTLSFLIFGAVWMQYNLRGRTSHKKYATELQSILTPQFYPMEDVIEYDRLEETSDYTSRARTPRSLWQTWYPGNELSILEVLQRHLDAWMEVLLEAGLDIDEYGRREDSLYPRGLLRCSYGEVRVCFEYGDHVGGCRIHVTEIWVCAGARKGYVSASEKEATSAEISEMPGGWNFEQE